VLIIAVAAPVSYGSAERPRRRLIGHFLVTPIAPIAAPPKRQNRWKGHEMSKPIATGKTMTFSE